MDNKDSDDRDLYNSRIVDNYIKIIKLNYSYVDIDDLLKSAGMKLYEVEDEAHWFTQAQLNQFHRSLRKKTGNKEIAREAGLHAASPGTLGMMRRYVLGLIGPQNAYELVGKYASKFTRSSTFKSKPIGTNKVEICVTPNEGVQEEPYQCENRLGFWESISIAFNYNLPKIEHPECIFKGGKSCRYIISWEKSPSYTWRKIRDFTGIFLTLFIVVEFFFPFMLPLPATFLIPTSIAIFLLINWHQINLDRQELKKAVENLHETSEELIEQTNINYENALLINEVSQALSKELELGNIIANVADVLEKRLDYDRGLILLANPDKTRLIAKGGFGYDPDQLKKFMSSGTWFHLNKIQSKGVFVQSFHKQKPFLINDISEIKDSITRKSLDFAQILGVKSFLCCPIIYENESLGVLAVDNVQTKKPLLQRDINILTGVANQIGISINNAKLIEARFKQFQSILQVLAATTDARDPITAGHSEKVTEYAVGICNQLGLSHNYTEMIRVSSLLHDYGKMGVDDAILKKPGRLNDEEYEHIKTHAYKSKEILQRVNFEGIYKEVPEVVGAHHEKLDGSGYPDGLTDDEIPFGSKIIAVADVFEALTSKRHYRDPMMINEAFDQLVSAIGNHFDAKCVEAFINYYNKHEGQIPYIYKGDNNVLGS
jgi:HD-GYP domain-containing protein (c-di-GMP phosphodiesterase class II)